MTEDPEHSLEISLFGPLEASINSLPLPRLRSRKTAWLLALLVLRSGREVERSWLAGTLWPDSDETAATVNLRSSLTDLRRALGMAATRLRSPSRHTLALDLTAATVDVTRFDAAIACGAAASLERAVGLYRGPLLEGCVEEWVLPEREDREQACLTALETLARWALAGGDPATAERHLRRAVALDPLRESAQRALMETQAAGGNLSAAFLTYRDLRLRLHRELNTQPAAATTALFQQLRSGANGGAGERGMRGSGLRVEGRVSRVEGQRPTDWSDTEPSTLDARPLTPDPLPRIPRPLTPLIGRDREISAIQSCLGENRLVTLTGAGGVGKTRLALHVALQHAEVAPHGVWFIELASLTSPALLPQEVVAALEISERPSRSLVDTLIEALGNEPLLLVLDNCERVVEACADLGAALLRACPNLRMLATSRRRLGVTGEVAFRVPSLMDEEAVLLFLERAAAAAPECARSEHAPDAVSEICRRLDNIPLAIELAAARLSVLTAEEIRTRLDDRFRLLAGGSRTALPQHQTLRATLDWSHSLLTEPERTLLRRLAVFAGGWTLDAAEAVCSDGVSSWQLAVGSGTDRTVGLPTANCQLPTDDVLDLLTSLVDASLVVVERSAGGMRYRLSETLREYAWERLDEAGEAEEVRVRHRDWFLRWSERADEALRGPNEAEWLGRWEREHDNLRVALHWTEERGEVEAGLRLVSALGEFSKWRGHWTEQRERLERVLAMPGAERHPAARAPALCWAGRYAGMQGQGALAQQRLEEALVIGREMGDKRTTATALIDLGCLAIGRGDDTAASAPLLEEGVAVWRELGDARATSCSLIILAGAARRRGDPEQARAHCEEALALARSVNAKAMMAYALCGLRGHAWRQGDDAAERTLYAELLTIVRTTTDKGLRTSLLLHVGNAAFQKEEYGEARALYEEGLAINRHLGKPPVSDMYLLHGLGNVHALEGDYRRAQRCYAAGLALGQEAAGRAGLAACVEGLACVLATVAQRQGCGRDGATAWAQRAARLFGAADALRAAFPPPDHFVLRAGYERGVAATRAALGEEAFAVAWAEGRVMSLPETLACAFADVPPDQGE